MGSGKESSGSESPNRLLTVPMRKSAYLKKPSVSR